MTLGSIRGAAWIAYGMIVTAFVIVKGCTPQPGLPTITAASALTAGHLLSTGDIVMKGAPHYLTRPVEAGKPIPRGALAQLQSVVTGADRTPVSLPFDPAAGAKVPGAGAKVWICPASTAADQPVSLVATICDRPGGTCLGIFAVPPARATAIAALTAPRLATTPCPKG